MQGVFLVGAGPGDPDLLTVKAKRLIETADTVVYDRLVGEGILDLIPAAAKAICVGKESGRHSWAQDEINALLLSLARQGGQVVRLKGGDPFVFGRGGEEVEHLRRHGFSCTIVPGVTAASGCAAAAGIPLTHRGLATSVRLVTGHCKNDEDLDLDWGSLSDPDCTLVVYMGLATAPRLVAELLAAGLPASTPVAAIERGTTPEQKTHVSTLGRLVQDLTAWRLKPPTLLVIGRVVALGQRNAAAERDLASIVQAAHA